MGAMNRNLIRSPITWVERARAWNVLGRSAAACRLMPMIAKVESVGIRGWRVDYLVTGTDGVMRRAHVCAYAGKPWELVVISGFEVDVYEAEEIAAAMGRLLAPPARMLGP